MFISPYYIHVLRLLNYILQNQLYSSESLHKLLNIMEINEMSFFLAPLKIPQCKIFYVGFQTCNN